MPEEAEPREQAGVTDDPGAPPAAASPEAPPDRDPAAAGDLDGAGSSAGSSSGAAAPSPDPADAPATDGDGSAPADSEGDPGPDPAAEAPADPAEAPLAAVLSRLDDVAHGIDALGERIAAVEAAVFAVGSTSAVVEAVDAVGQRVGEVARLGDRHNELIDKLHSENQSLRKGELTQALSPLFRDLVRLADQLTQLDDASPEPGRGDAAIAVRQVVEILARAGVRPVEVGEGDPFDAALHQGLGRLPTADRSADGHVASVRRAGYLGPDGRILRPSEVEVWRYEEPPDDSAAAGPTDVVPVAVPPPEPPTPADTGDDPAAPGDAEGDD